MLNPIGLRVVSLVCQASTGWSTTSSGISPKPESNTSSASTVPTSRIFTTQPISGPEITAVLAKHEFSAATMADGYSRSGAGLGVVAATSGGGALNLIPALGESFTSRIPVLALVGQPATGMDGRGSFQDTSGRNGSLNAEALFSQTSVFCRRITNASRHHLGVAGGHRRGANRWPGSAVAAQRHSAIDYQSRSFRGSLSATFHRQSAADLACSAAGDRPGHDHRRRTSGPRRRACRTGRASGGAACTSRVRARCQGRRGNTGLRLVVGARCHRCDGSPGRARGGGRKRAVSGRGHSVVGDRAGRPRRCAGRRADDLDRFGAAVPRLHPCPHR